MYVPPCEITNSSGSSSSAAGSPTLASIGLSISTAIQPSPLGGNAAYVRFDVTCANGFDGNVFIYQRDPVNPATNTYADHFSAVASANDIAEVPTDSPTPASPLTYRLPYVEAYFDSSTAAEAFQTFIKGDIGLLINALNLPFSPGLTVTPLTITGAVA